VTVVIPSVWQFARMEMQTFLTYRLNLGLQLLGILLQVYLLKVVWTAVYGGRADVDGIALGTLIAFLTLANLHVWAIYPQTVEVLPQRIQSGAIALDLARPVGLFFQLAGRSVGATLGLVTLVVVALPLAAVLGSVRAPASAEAAGLYIVSLLLGYGITLAIGVILGMVAFWTLEIHGFSVLYHFINQFFAGALIPLWFMPDWLRQVAELLPFQTQAFLPLSIYFGQLAGADALRALGIQAAWLVALWIAAAAIFRAAIRRVVIQGG
jgi:ABC-type uncharacterized transport system permease subunit